MKYIVLTMCLCLAFQPVIRGISRISRKEAHMYKGKGVRFADFISIF